MVIHRPPLCDHAFDVRLPHQLEGAWWYAIEGTTTWRHGPFPTDRRAHDDLEQRFQRWRHRARGQGGWAWRRAQHTWVVTVPVGVVVPGRPLRRAPCTVHGGELPGTNLATEGR